MLLVYEHTLVRPTKLWAKAESIGIVICKGEESYVAWINEILPSENTVTQVPGK